MSGLVVDTSALVAILNQEPEARDFATACHDAETLMISAGTLHEANCVMVRSNIDEGTTRLDALVRRLDLTIAAFDAEQLEASRAAYMLYGRGTGHPALLNMGDCFAYALAKTRRLPLLFKGNDFVHTDIEPALKPA